MGSSKKAQLTYNTTMDTSAVITAAKWIGTWLIEERTYLNGVEDQVRRLQDELECMIGLLQESDLALQLGHDPQEDIQLSIFTKKIRQIAFQAEDVIDTYILKVASPNEGRTRFTKYAYFVPNSLLIHQTGNQIEAIINEAKEANNRLNRYRVVPKLGSVNKLGTSMMESYAHTHEDEMVIGFDDHIHELVEKLINIEDKSWVIGIVGTGGAGKTSLARKVFNHIDITSHFELKAWVSISQQWTRRDILYEILRQTRGGMNENEKTNWTDRELVEKLLYFLKTERYIIVLDDIWDEKAWDEFRDAIPRFNNGSKVLITTRNQQVAIYADPNCFVLEPRLLDHEKGWELFSKIAIYGRNVATVFVTSFENLGKEMVTKCGGLPLAIVTLAGLLRTQQTLDDWEHINKAYGDNILEHNKVVKIISLSYLHLPPHLKPCFLYLAVFPEDTAIPRNLLTKLWIAEGFVTEGQQCGQEKLEDVAKRCVDELVRRCILQVVRRNCAGIATEYRLHDLMRDFCIAKAKDQNFLEVFSPMDEFALDTKVSSQQARRAMLHSGMSLPAKNSYLRSLIRFGKSGPYIGEHVDFTYDMAKTSMKVVYENFKLLRVLNLWGIETSSWKLSKEIGNLIHLRYLAIKLTNITKFPKAIGILKNLLTLDLRHNIIESIAFTLSNLVRIRHLYLGWGVEYMRQDLGLDKLKDLQTLKCVFRENWMIKEIVGLSKGIRKLKICAMNSTEQLEAVYRCLSIMVDSLQTLYLLWLDEEKLKLDLEKITKCRYLKKLTLHGRINEDNLMAKLLQFPPNIVYVEVEGSRLQGNDWIIALGKLSYLKFLHLGKDSYEGAKLIMKTDAFPQLETFKLHSLPNLDECRMEEGALACLKVLDLWDCPKLQRLPEELRTITTLETLKCGWMSRAFCKKIGWEEDDERYITIRNTSIDKKSATCSKTTIEDGRVSKQRSGEDFHIVQHIPTIIIQ